MDDINLNPQQNNQQPQRPTPPPIPLRFPVEPQPSAAPRPIQPSPEGIKILKGDLEKVIDKSEIVEKVMEEMEEERPGKGVFKKIFTLVAVLAVIGGVGALAYYVVFPLVFPAPVAEQPEAPETPALTHASYFVKPPASKSRITFKEINPTVISDALNQLAIAAAPPGTLKEVEIVGDNGQISSADYLDRLVNLTVSKATLSGWLEGDFTAFIYYDMNAAWPGYVFKIKSGVESVKSDLYPDIESSATDFYLNPTTLGAWKNGSVKGTATRYALGSLPGEAFNYGIFGNFLVLSTNFEGFKAALAALGF